MVSCYNKKSHDIVKEAIERNNWWDHSGYNKFLLEEQRQYLTCNWQFIIIYIITYHPLKNIIILYKYRL